MITSKIDNDFKSIRNFFFLKKNYPGVEVHTFNLKLLEGGGRKVKVVLPCMKSMRLAWVT